MIKPSEIVTEARKWIDTPFHHQACVKGVGVDCINLVTGVLSNLGVDVIIPKDYAREPDGTIERELFKRLKPIEIQEGALLLFRIRKTPQHVAIATENGMIHSYSGGGKKVVEHGIDPWWSERLIKVYALPQVKYVSK